MCCPHLRWIPGVETDPGVVGYQRVVGKARVSRGILDDEYPGAVHSMTAERRFAAGGSDVEATTGFEPLALCVDQADERDGDVEESARRVIRSKRSSGSVSSTFSACRAARRLASFGGIGGVSMSRNLRQPPAAHPKCQFLTGRASPSPCGGVVDALACGDEEDRRGPARRRSGAVFPA